MPPIREIAPAKVNLGLKVLGRRPDGYHDVLSVVQTVDLYDELLLEEVEGETIELTCSDPALPAGEDNLVVKAANALKRRLGSTRGARIHLEKRIPAGGGLGGGSSDAAAALRGLCRLWNVDADLDLMVNAALAVGSDVPFLCRPGTAIMSGRGERLTYVELGGPEAYVLALPEVSVSTPWAFANIRIGLTESSPYVSFLSSLPGSGDLDPGFLFQHLENDFQPLVSARFPDVERALEAVRSTNPVAASLSGTGSTLFGIYDDVSGATQAALALRDKGLRSVVCRPLTDLPRL